MRRDLLQLFPYCEWHLEKVLVPSEDIQIKWCVDIVLLQNWDGAAMYAGIRRRSYRVRSGSPGRARPKRQAQMLAIAIDIAECIVIAVHDCYK